MIDLTGKTFGRLIVQNKTTKRKDGQILWKCHCSCGNIRFIRGFSLRCGDTKSCGCLNRELIGKRAKTYGKDFSGTIVNGILLIERTTLKLRGSYKYRARCPKCNREDWIVYPGHIRAGGSTQCLACARETMVSNVGKVLLDKLEKHLDTKIIREYKLDKYYYDGYIPKFNILIESDCSYWHSSEKAKNTDKQKDTLAHDMGFKLIRIKNENIKDINDTVNIAIATLDANIKI